MNIEDLGRRAVACRHWRWMNGMLLLPHVDGCECCEDRNFPRKAAHLPSVFPTEVDVPDFSDPATLGCLLHLVREAWGGTAYHVRPDGLHWRVWAFEPGARVYATEAEALVAALEDAP
jgi:hypothetical protein